jgi:hypothetical protein
MREALVITILSVMAVAAFGSAQSVIAASPKTASAGLPAGYDQVIAPTDSGGPPGADEIQYDNGQSGGWYSYLPLRTRYAVRMDPAYYPAIVVQCDVCIIEDCWPFPPHDSIYVQVWIDRNGDSMPEFPAVWSGWVQDADTSIYDTAAVTIRVPLGQVICRSGSFWVGMMMDTVHNGAFYATIAMDNQSRYPDHQVFYDPAGDTWGYWLNNDMMIRSWTMRQGLRNIVVSAVEAPSGQIWAGDSVTPQALFANLGNGADSAWVWMRIENTDSTDNYADSCWVRLDPLQTFDTTYRAWSPLYAGIYRMQCTTERIDTNWTYLTVLAREGVGAGPLPPGLTGSRIEVGPNPVRNAAEIRYSVAVKSRVALRILDARGTVVRTLVADCSAPGEHLAVWDARDDHGHPAARGIYFVRLESRDCQETRKVVLTR